ncbi:MAG: TatD family hydrolase [Bacteroidales bacterium]|nr:TatD family hydrolase [Bacteroidales bacterium]
MHCDIHTHNPNPRIPSLIDVSGCEDFAFFRAEAYFSYGIHPQSVADDGSLALRLDFMRQAASSHLIHAIGECGLDKFAPCSREAGIRAFRMQVDIAAEYQLPIVVHCVRLYSDVVSVLKDSKFALPVILHSYNGNQQTTAQLLRLENVYFSFCQLKNQTGLKSIPMIPTTRILLESDTEESPDFAESLTAVSALKNMCAKELEDIIFYNFVKIIGG